MRDLWGTLWLVSIILYITFPGKFAIFLFFLSLAGMFYDWYAANHKNQIDDKNEKSGSY